MATKKELIATLKAAGYDEVSMADDKEVLELAVAALDSVTDRRKGV